MKRIKQVLLTLLCLGLTVANTPVTAGAGTLVDGNANNANMLQENTILDDALYEKWASESNGKFTSAALKEFALDLQNIYVPRILSGITQTFSFAQKPSAKGMKIGLEFYNNTAKNAALAMVESNGIQYKLRINMSALTATNEGKVNPDADYGAFYGSLAHELLHAVMFDVTPAGMLGDGYWNGNGYTETVDDFPSWFYEGICQTVGGGIEWCDKLRNDLYEIQPEWENRNKEKETKEWLNKFYWLGNEAYAQGYIACLYLGHIAGGDTGSVTGGNIAKGLNAIVLDVEDGYSLSQAIYRQTGHKYTGIEDFQQKFADDAYNFTFDFLDSIDAHSSDINWHATGSLLARDGLGVSKLVMYQGLSGESDYFALDISCGGMFDNSGVLGGRNVRTGGGMTHTKGFRRDGTVNNDAKNPWTADSYKDSGVAEEKQYTITLVADESGGGAVTGAGVYKENETITVIAQAHEGYKFIRWLEEGREVSTDDRFEIRIAGDRVLTAVFEKIAVPGPGGGSGSGGGSGPGGGIITVNNGGQAITTVYKATADKLIETAVANKSEEIVISAVTKNQSAASDTKASEVALPAETLQTIADKTNASIVIKTDVAQVKLDNKAAGAVASQAQKGTAGKNETVSIVAERVNEEDKEVRIELKVVTSSGAVISDFKGGSVRVTVNVPKSLSNKKLVCVYIDENEYMHKVDGELNADGTYSFTTGHFSTYAIMSEEEADAAIAEQKKAVKALKLKLRTQLVKTKSGKKAIKLTWTGTGSIDLDGVQIFRSVKKNSGYGKKPVFTSKSGQYTNTSVKSGKKYYYMARGFVTIDGQKVYTDYSPKAVTAVK